MTRNHRQNIEDGAGDWRRQAGGPETGVKEEEGGPGQPCTVSIRAVLGGAEHSKHTVCASATLSLPSDSSHRFCFPLASHLSKPTATCTRVPLYSRASYAPRTRASTRVPTAIP